MTGAASPERWAIEIQQYRQVYFLKARFDGIAKCNIDHNRNPCPVDRSVRGNAQAAILRLFTNAVDLYAVNVKDYAIVERNGAHVLKDANHFFFIVVAKSQEIQVFCRTQGVFEPLREQHRTFQNEAVAMLRLTQAI